MKRKILSLFLALTMTVSLFTVGAGAAEPIYRDTDGHWAAETIEGFSRLGLIEGYNGQFFPNKNITRGEMAVILDRLMDYQTAAKNSFSDLGEAFYTDAVLKANAVGVMLGSNGTVRPTDPITRQEAAVLLCRALGLEGGGSVAQFSDRGQIASWAADAVGVMAAKKLLQGANGMFRPADAITRAETVAILDRALGKLVSAGESASGRVDGDVVVRGAGAKLSDMTINGDLIIAEGVGEGEVHLDGVTITGRTIVRGGGEHSIYMNNVRANGGVVVNKLDGKVRVVTSGNTTVSVTLLQSGAILVGDGFKTVEIPADVAKGQTVEIQGNIERLVNSSEDAKITANGTIQTVEANVKTEIKGDAKVVGATGSADVKVNGSAVAKTDKPAAGGNSGSGGSSGGNSSTASKEITGAEVVTLKVGYGDKTAEEALAAIPKTVTLKLKDGSTISATVTNWKWGTDAAYDPKPSTPDSTPAVATVTIPSGYTYNGTLTATAKVTVLPLDKAKLEAAKGAYMDLQDKQTYDEQEAAADNTKILITDKAADAVTEGVRFTTNAAKNALETAISKAETVEKNDSASQKDYDDTAKTLQAAITTFEKSIKTGTLKKQAFDDALKAANDVFNNTVNDEKTAATDKTKILIIDNKTPADITEGVQFTTSIAKNTLETAISNAKNAEKAGFASQKDYDAAADALQKAVTAFKNTIQTGTNKTTDAYILQQAKDVVAENRNWDAPYSSYKQPLQLNYVYKFVAEYFLDSTYLTFEWEAQWKNQNETGNIGDYIEIGSVSGTGGTYSMGAKVIKEPNEPKEVQFVVTVKAPNNNREIGKLGENGEYPATIGAPISVSADQPDTLPQFTATNDAINATNATKFTGVVPITLNGADAIASAPNDCVTIGGSDSSSKVLFSSISVDQVKNTATGLNVTVSVTTGSIGGVWNGAPSIPASSDGKFLNISIDPSKLQLKTMDEGNSSWYLPSDALKLGEMTVDVLTPAFTKVEHTDDQATGNPTFTIHTRSMPDNAQVEVALAKKDVGANNVENDNATIKATATRGDDGKYSVTFDKNQFDSNATYYLWFRYGSPGSDWAYENENSRPTYTPNSTTGGESGGSGSTGDPGSGGTGSEGGQAGA